MDDKQKMYFKIGYSSAIFTSKQEAVEFIEKSFKKSKTWVFKWLDDNPEVDNETRIGVKKLYNKQSNEWKIDIIKLIRKGTFNDYHIWEEVK